MPPKKGASKKRIIGGLEYPSILGRKTPKKKTRVAGTAGVRKHNNRKKLQWWAGEF